MEDDLGFDIVDLDNGGDNNDLGFDVLSDNDLGFDVLSEREQVEIDQANYVADRGTLGQAGDSLKRGGSRSLAALSVSNARATDDQAERYQKLLETELAKPEFTSDNAAEYRPGQFRSKRKIQRYENAIARSNANTDEALDRAIKADQIGQAIPQAPVISYAMEAETAGEFLSRVGIDAGSFIGNITLESAPSFVSSAAGGVAGFAVGGAVGAAVGSGLAAGGDDYNFTFLESLREQGVDLSDKKALRAAFRDPAMMDAIRNDALKRATVVGGAAGLTAYIAPLRLFPTDTLTRLAADITGKAVVGAGLDGAGEYFGEIARGREPRTADVLAEVAGGIGGSAVEVAPLAVQGSRQAVQKLLPDTDPQDGDTELDQFIDENAEGLGLVDPDDVTAPATPARSGLLGPDQVAAIDASTLSLDGVEANDGLAVETPAELEARLYPPQEGDFDYIPPGDVTTGDLELSPEGTGVDGSLARTEQPAAPADELSPEPLDESAPVSRSQAGLQTPPVGVPELENEQQVEARLAQQGEPAAELPRTPEVVNAQKFTRLANQYDELASNATDPEIKSGLERQAEIARKTAAGENIKLTPKERAAQARVIKPGSDTIDIAVRRLGGLDVDTETDFAGRLKQLDANDKTPGLPGIEQRNGKGLTLDALTERLMTEGFVDQFDQKILSDLLERAAGGEEIYSNAVDFDLLAQRDFEQERDDDAFRTAVQVANIRPLKETTQDLIDLGLSKTEVDRLLGELRADGLTAPEISEGFEDMADAMRERARSQSTVPADSGIQSETPSNEQANGSGAGPQSELRPRPNQQRQSQRQGELPNDEDGQHSATVEPLRQGEDVKQRQREVDTADGSGEQSTSSARIASQQQRSNSAQDKSQDNSERGSGERQGSSARAADEQSGSDSEGQVGKDSASGNGSVRSKADRQKPRKQKVLLNLVDKAAADADPSPTPKQAEAENYRKGHVRAFGFDISIETARGEDRVGYDKDGEEAWRNTLGAHYGGFLRTTGADGDNLDVFLGEYAEEAEKYPAFVMNQRKPNGRGFDELKTFIGFSSAFQARKAYLASYPKGWKGVNDLIPVTASNFKLWLNHGDHGKAFKKIASIKEAQQRSSAVQNVEGDEAALQQSEESRLQGLRGQGDKDLQAVGSVPSVRSGSGGKASGNDTRANQKQPGVQSEKLPVGNDARAGGKSSGRKEVPVQGQDANTNGADGNKRDGAKNAARSNQSRVDGGRSGGDSAKSKISKQEKSNTGRSNENNNGVGGSRGNQSSADQLPDEAGLVDQGRNKNSAKKQKLDDFGGKIGNARKDVYSRYGKGYDIEIDYETAPLSKALPKPDYEAMAADGISQRNIAFVAFMRADLGQRPKGRYARSRTAEWVKKAGMYRVLAQEIMEKRPLDIPDTGDLRVQLDFLQSVPPDLVDKASAYTMHEYDKLDQKTLQPNGVVAFEIRKRTGSRRPIARAEDDMQAAIKQAVNFLRKPADKKGGDSKRKPIPLGVYTHRSTRKSFIGFKRVGTYVRIKDGFDGPVKAQAYLRENREALDAQVEEMRGPPSLRTEANRVRIGKPRRDGDVTPEDFGLFGLYGLEFGNWVEGPRRQANLNEAYDAMIDMAEALNLEPAALSLSGTLGLAFGARGKGGVNAGAAHFEPDSIAINLTKKAGAGSLAHEWLHGIDNYFARLNASIEGRKAFSGFMTDLMAPGAVRPELYESWKDIVSSFKGTRMLETSKEFDALFKGKRYYQTDIELMARAFETYITDKLAKVGITNDYLANIDKSSGVYPDADELKVIAPKFDKFFSQLKQEKTEAGIRLAEDNASYNRVEAMRRGYLKSDKQDEFDFSTPTSEEAHADPEGEATRSVLRLRGFNASVLANVISKDFIDKSSTSLIGKPIRSSQDLAVAAQVYRNPSFETLRFFVTNGTGEVIHQSGVTSRLPGSVSFNNSMAMEFTAQIRSAMGDDPDARFWFLHNHPSGDSHPSNADEIMTRNLANEIDASRFASHVIINDLTFSSLDKDGYLVDSYASLGNVEAQYLTGINPGIPSPLLGQRITGTDDVARIAKRAEGATGPLLVMVGSEGGVNGIMEFPFEILNSKNNGAALIASLRKAQLHSAARKMMFANMPSLAELKKMPNVVKNLGESLRIEGMADVIDRDGNGLFWELRDFGYSGSGAAPYNKPRIVAEQEVTYARADQYQQSILERAKKQPIDTAFMLPFAAAAGLSRKSGVTAAVRHAAGSGAQAAGNYYSEKMGFLHPVVETGATLFIDRYGLPAEYKKLDQSRTNKERSLQMRALDLVRKIEGELGNDLKTARAFQRVLTSEVPAGRDMQALGEEVRNEITALGERAVSLGMVSRESFERNKAIYLHRVYEQYEVADNGSYGIGAKFLKNRRTRIMGDAFKGRGIFQEVKNNRLSQDLPDGLLESRQMDKGSKFRIVDMIRTDDTLLGESDNRKVVKRYYLKTNQDIPTIDGTEAVDRGVFEVRQTKKNSVVLWRDYSESERTKMGEITDSRYTLIRTMQILSHDLATGEFYRDIAKNDAWTWNQPGEPDSENILEGSEIMLNAYRPLYGVEWVRMPDATIPKSGGKKKYGDLSGKYIRAEIYRDLMAIQAQQNPNLWTKLLSQWKVNKTARNPVTHMNNVMSNVILADLVDVRADHLVAALKSWAAKDTNHREATELGAFGGGFIEGEIKAEVLDRVIREIEAERNNTENDSLLDSVLAHTTMGSMIEKLAALDNAALSAYQLEDEVFRLAAFIKFKEEGMNPDDAAIKARDQFLNYDIRAPGVNALRRTILPFASYTYRAVPVIAEAVMKRPWKIAKYFGMAWMFQAMAYAITGGDEDEERRSLRDEESGFTWIGLPRMVRMPWNTNDGRPVFLDSRRWIPAGDVFDTAQGSSAIPIPAPLQPGGPIGMVFEVMLNKQGFTGQEITNELADDNTTKALKIADYLWKSWMPSNVLIPGSWYQQKIYDAATGAVDRTGRDYSVAQAIASSFGIKLKPQDVSYNMQLKAEQLQRTVRAIRTEINRLSRKKMRNQVSDASYDRQMARYLKQLNNVQEKARETFSPAQ